MRLRFIPMFAALLSSAACDRCGLDPIAKIPAAGEQPDVFTQKGAAQVDILWMIDNSGSMEAEQEKVAERFNQFFNQLIVSQVDYHIGVITSDPAEGGVLRQYSGAAVESCAACRFITKDVPCPNPAVDISGLASEAAINAALADACHACPSRPRWAGAHAGPGHRGERATPTVPREAPKCSGTARRGSLVCPITSPRPSGW